MHFKSPNGLQQTLVTSTSGAGINNNGDDYARVRNGKFTWTSVPKSSLVNEFRFGWNTDLEGDNVNPTLGPAFGALAVSVNSQSIGSINNLPRVQPRETRFEFADNVSWVTGKHIVKAGVDLTTTNDYSYFVSNAFGSYTYQNVNAFALDYSDNTTGAKHWQTFCTNLRGPNRECTNQLIRRLSGRSMAPI